jgi:hypothetical protein
VSVRIFLSTYVYVDGSCLLCRFSPMCAFLYALLHLFSVFSSASCCNAR